MKREVRMRKAVAMIELIFAIVILGITMMSAPMLISTATQSGYVTMQQESIAIASSKMGIIMTHHWDEQGSDENITTPILLTNGDPQLDQVFIGAVPTGKRAGSLNIETQRSFLTTVGPGFSASPGMGIENIGVFNDVDDYNNDNAQVVLAAVGEDTDNLVGNVGDVADRQVQVLSTVRYMSDALEGGTYLGDGGNTITYSPFNDKATPPNPSNIKHINVTLTTNAAAANPEMAKTIIFNAFSCNIGSYELEERSF